MKRHVLKEYSDLLIENAKPLFETGMHWIYMNDVVWSKLMRKSKRWYFHPERLGYQRPSFSDLGKRFIDTN